MDKKSYEIGRTYWTSEGKEVELLAITADGQYVVSTTLAYDDWEDRRYVRGETLFVTELFMAPPRERVDAELMRLRQEVSDLEKRKWGLECGLIETEKQSRERLNKLSKFKGLERLEDFIEGRITHLLVDKYSSWEIQPISFIDYYSDESSRGANKMRDGLKLITLFGDTKGDLTWRVNRYYDGSGSNQIIYPCTSEDEAKELMARLLTEALQKAYVDLKEGKLFALMNAVHKALDAKIPVPADLLAVYKVEQRKNLEKNLKDKLNTVDIYAKQAACFEKQLAELDDELSGASAPVDARAEVSA